MFRKKADGAISSLENVSDPCPGLSSGRSLLMLISWCLPQPWACRTNRENKHETQAMCPIIDEPEEICYKRIRLKLLGKKLPFLLKNSDKLFFFFFRLN